MNTVQQVFAWVSENWDVLAQAATLVVAALPTGADSGVFGRIVNLLRLLPFVPRPSARVPLTDKPYVSRFGDR